LKMMVNLSIKE